MELKSYKNVYLLDDIMCIIMDVYINEWYSLVPLFRKYDCLNSYRTLDPVADDQRTVVLQIKNTSDKKGLDLVSEIKMAIEEKVSLQSKQRWYTRNSTYHLNNF